MPAAMISDTTSLAESMVRNEASSVFTASAWRRRRTVTFVAIPKVPSDPTKRPVRS